MDSLLLRVKGIFELDTGDAEKDIENIAKTIDHLMKNKSGSSRITAMQQQAKDLYKQYQNIQNVWNSLSDSEKAVPSTLQAYNDALAESNAKFRQLAIQYQNFQRQAGQSGNNSPMQQTFSALNRALGDTLGLIPRVLAGVRNISTRVVQGVLGIFPRLIGNLKSIGQSLKRNILMIAGTILGVRGLMSILNKLRSSVLAGFKDIYNQDKQFKTQIDTIKQKILDIQVAFAEALMPVIQMALPYVKALLDWILSLLGTLQRFISTVTGIQAYTKAIKGLGGAAQKASHQLSKLDELNNLTEQGGNGLTPNNASIGDPEKVTSWFEFTRNIIDNIERMLRAIPWDAVYKKAETFGRNVGGVINGIFKPSFWNAVGETVSGALNTILHFFNALGKRLNAGDIGKSIFQFFTGVLDKFDFGLLSDTLILWADKLWTIVKTVLTERGSTGETLAQRLVGLLTNALGSIDWPKVYAKVQEVAQTLAGTLNQLIDPELAQNIGRTLGGTFMSIIKFAIAFFGDGGFDWENLGNTIAEGINGFFEEFDGGELAKGINVFMQGVITAFKKVIQEVDWAEVWSDIKTLLSDLDWKSTLSVITVTMAPTLLKILWDVIKVIWVSLKGPLLNFLRSVVWPEISAFFETIFGNLPGFFSTMLSAITTGIALLLEFLGIWQLIAGLGESISLLFGKDFMGVSSEEWAESSPIALLLKGITGSFDADAWDEVWFEFFDDFVSFWGTDGNFIQTITGFGKSMQDKINTLGENLGTSFVTFMRNIDEKAGAWWDENVVPFFGFEKWVNVLATPKQAFEQIVDEAIEFWTIEVPNWWTNHVAPWFTLEKWLGIVSNIKNAIMNVWMGVQTWWNTNITSWWYNNVSPWFTLTKWLTLLDGIKTAFDIVFKGAANLAINALNKVIEALETMLGSGIGGVVNSLGDKLNSHLPSDKQLPTFTGIKFPRIPALATGTVIPPSMSKFVAQLGDNDSETEVVSPLSTMKQAMIEALQETGGGSGEYHIHVEVDGREIAKAVVKQNDIYRKSSGGKSLFAY